MAAGGIKWARTAVYVGGAPVEGRWETTMNGWIRSFSVAALAVGFAGCGAGEKALVELTLHASFDEASRAAAKRDVPVLVDFYATWCGPCKTFSEDVDTDNVLREALGEVAFVKLDAEQEGEELAERYSVSGYPSFVLLRHDGEVIDRWMGYETASEFIEKLRAAAADTTTLAEKIERFEAAPTARGAALLGRIHGAQDSYAAAIAYYRKAQELDPSADHAMSLFVNTFSGRDEVPFDDDEIRAAADRVTGDVRDLTTVAQMMAYLAERRDDPSLMHPYLERALEASEGSNDESVLRVRNDLLVTRALEVEGDKQRAVELKRSGMPDGWRDDAAKLNAFAWWCFQNEVSLEEAERLARRGVELAEPGKERAMILDTLAELCNANGDCGTALDLIVQAIAEDPDNPYYEEQRARFAELVVSN